MVSDNATTFTSSASQIKKIQEHPSIQNILNINRTKWIFIPSRAPWFGGFWERLIGMTKNSIKKTLGRALITIDELRTLITEVEAGLNDRPLTYASGNLDDIDPVTPSQLIYGFRIQSLPSPIEEPTDEDLYLDRPLLTKRQLKCARLLEYFWQRWRTEYLTSLRERQSSSKVKNLRQPKVGDIVQIHDDTPRLLWKLGKILELHVGTDGFIRSVKLKMGTGVVTRAVQHLYPLEVSADDYQLQPKEIGQFKRIRPARQAALKAAQRIKEMAD
jgi:hypothetical protein